MEQSDTTTTVPTVASDELRMPEATATPKHHKVLNMAIIGVLVLILLILAICLYIWGRAISTPVVTDDHYTRPTDEQNNEPESTTAEAQTATLEAVSTSNELDAIETDIEATTFSEFDGDFAAIEAEMQ